MSSLLQEKISQIIRSYTRMNTKKDNQKFVQDLVALLLGEKMDKINLGSSLWMIEEELMKQQKNTGTTESLMEDIKTNMSNVLTNAIMNRIK